MSNINPNAMKQYLMVKDWDQNKETGLKKIATEGVIAFFNAVSKSKKEMRQALKTRKNRDKEMRIKKDSKKKFLKHINSNSVRKS